MDNDKKKLKQKSKQKHSAKNRAIWLLSRKEYTESELRNKLKEYPEEEINETLDFLKENNWQSDERAAKSIINSYIDRGQGPGKIKVRTRQVGLNEGQVNQLIEQKEVDWKGKALDITKRKFGEGPFEREIQVKVSNFLARRGFDLSICWEIAKWDIEEN